MAVAMPKLERALKSGNWRARKVIPVDARPVLGQRESKRTWPAALSETEARAAYAKWLAEIEEKIAAARRGFVTLTDEQVLELAARWYRQAKRDNSGSHEDGPEGYRDVLKLLDQGDASPVVQGLSRNNADALLQRDGINADEDSRARLAKEIQHLWRALFIDQRRHTEGVYSPDPEEARLPPPTPRQPSTQSINATGVTPSGKPAPRLLDLFELWASHPEQIEAAANTKKRYRPVFKALAKELNNPPATSVTNEQVAAYLDGIMERGVSPRTANSVHKAAISSVFNWAKKGRRIVAMNPAEGYAIRVRKPRLNRPKGFTNEEAATILRAALAITQSNTQPLLSAAKRWVPFLLAYSGARVQEMTQLRKQDVRKDNQSGIWFLDLTPDAGTIKDREARPVPLHPRLVDMGFLHFVRSSRDGEPLFYDRAACRNPNAVSKQAASRAGDLSQWVRKEVGVTDKNISPNHAWRHRFKTFCRNAGIDEAEHDALTGHAPASQGRAYGETPLASLYAAICKLIPDAIEGATPAPSTVAMRPAKSITPEAATTLSKRP